MRIHPLVWIIVGAFVSVVSFFLGDAMDIFFWVGLLFVAMGITKQLIAYVLDPENGTAWVHGVAEKPQGMRQQAFSMPKPEGRPQHAVRIGPTCPYCMRAVTRSDNFCSSCGTRLR